jgi:hypothetical protein
MYEISDTGMSNVSDVEQRTGTRNLRHGSLTCLSVSNSTEDKLCSKCQDVDLGKVLASKPALWYGDVVIEHLGVTRRALETSCCPLSQLIATIWPPGYLFRKNRSEEDDHHELRALSSTDVWVVQGECGDGYRPEAAEVAGWVDTMFLAVVPEPMAGSLGNFWMRNRILGSRFLSPVVPTCSNGLFSIRIMEIASDRVNYDMILGWLSTCHHDHVLRCDKPAGPSVPFLRLIYCTTREIVVPEPESQIKFVALSYVWDRPSTTTHLKRDLWSRWSRMRAK